MSEYIPTDLAAQILSITPQAVRALCLTGSLASKVEPFGPGTKRLVLLSAVIDRAKQLRKSGLKTSRSSRKPLSAREIRKLAKTAELCR